MLHTAEHEHGCRHTATKLQQGRFGSYMVVHEEGAHSPVATGPADDQCTENMVRSWRPVTVVSSLQRGLPAGKWWLTEKHQPDLGKGCHAACWLGNPRQ